VTDRVPLTTADLAGGWPSATDDWRERLATLARGDGDSALHLAVAERAVPWAAQPLRRAPVRRGRRVLARPAAHALRHAGTRRQPEHVAPTPVAKSDRRAWVTLDR
jgi:hypothetical protein